MTWSFSLGRLFGSELRVHLTFFLLLAWVGFAAYAQDVGAADLPELLEAAAAYMSYVEGRDQFSRPQLMTTLRQAEVTDSSREDRLRSFGQLLREGKIRKTSGGRFTAAETISYKPAANG